MEKYREQFNNILQVVSNNIKNNNLSFDEVFYAQNNYINLVNKEIEKEIVNFSEEEKLESTKHLQLRFFRREVKWKWKN